MEILIENGRVIDPESGIDAVTDIFVSGGKIAAIGAAPPGFHANRKINAEGLVVCPGLVDLSARLREPGLEYKATLESEMARSGIRRRHQFGLLSRYGPGTGRARPGGNAQASRKKPESGSCLSDRRAYPGFERRIFDRNG